MGDVSHKIVEKKADVFERTEEVRAIFLIVPLSVHQNLHVYDRFWREMSDCDSKVHLKS